MQSHFTLRFSFHSYRFELDGICKHTTVQQIVHTLLNIRLSGQLTRMIFICSDTKKVYSAQQQGNESSEGQGTWFKVQKYFFFNKSLSCNDKNYLRPIMQRAIHFASIYRLRNVGTSITVCFHYVSLYLARCPQTEELCQWKNSVTPSVL
jgi:hypothetical protein